jgi:hypothetical protein
MATTTLTPSEALLLAAAAPEAGTTRPIVVRVPADAAVHELLAVALLANADAGAVTFENGSAKRLFGLRTVPVLRMQPTARAGTIAWPANSLEAHTLAAAIKLAAKGKHEVAEVCDAVVDLDPNPEGDVVLTMVRALTARGLVVEHAEQKTTLKVFKRTHRSSVLTEAGIEALRATPASGAAALIEACRRDRPAVWSEIWKGVTQTFSRKTQSDAGDFSGPD